MFIIDSHCTSDPGVRTHLHARLTGLCSGMPAVFSDPITTRGIGREASANQHPLATNKYIPTADGHINLGAQPEGPLKFGQHGGRIRELRHSNSQ